MSLQRIIILSISLVLLVLLLCNTVLSVLNARSYFSTQMKALSEDAATSLGLTISHAAQEKDLAQVETMISVVFDRGYYLSINYVDFDGQVLVSRSRDINIEGVPSWFVNGINIPSPTGDAEVVSGWLRLGVIYVIPHPGYAYQELWRVTINQLWLFLFSIIFSSILLTFVVRNILKPLKRVEQQANAVVEEKFVTNHYVPKVLELRSLTEAMNSMVTKIQKMFRDQIALSESLRKENDTDDLTGLPNQKDFDARVIALLADEEGQGSNALVLISVSNIIELNQKNGRDFGDELLQTLALILDTLHGQWHSVLVGRHRGADFAVFLPGFLAHDIDHFVHYVYDEMEKRATSKLLALSELSQNSVIRFGFALSEGETLLPDMLKAADEASRIAAARSFRFASVSLANQDEHLKGAHEWLSVLTQVIENKAIILYGQKILPLSERLELQPGDAYEVFCRIKEDEKIITAGVFWPLLERYELVSEVDQIVIEKSLAYLENHSHQYLTVNIALQSIVDHTFQAWLTAILDKHKLDVCKRVVFEFPERALVNHLDDTKRLIHLLFNSQVKISIDRFGIQPACLSYLHELNIDMVKVDRRFIADIQHHKENRFYLKTLVQITQSAGCLIIADGVESEDECQVLTKLGINALQGFAIHKPSAL